MRAALHQGHERLEAALLASAMPESYADDAWRHNDPPALPSMTAENALMLFLNHQRRVLWGELPRALRRRHGESLNTYEWRISALWKARQQAGRDAYTIAEAQRRANDGLEEGEASIVLPDWAQLRAR